MSQLQVPKTEGTWGGGEAGCQLSQSPVGAAEAREAMKRAAAAAMNFILSECRFGNPRRKSDDFSECVKEMLLLWC